MLDIFSVPSVSWLKVFPGVSITKQNPNTVRVRFGGDTWSFKSQFSECAIPGRYEDSDGKVVPSTASLDEKKSAEYARHIKSINVKGDVAGEFIRSLFLNTLYKGTMVKVTWTGPYKSEEPVHELKIKLEGLPNVRMRVGM